MLGRRSGVLRIVLSRVLVDPQFKDEFNRVAIRTSIRQDLGSRLARYADRLGPGFDPMVAAEMLISLSFELGFHPPRGAALGHDRGRPPGRRLCRRVRLRLRLPHGTRRLTDAPPKNMLRTIRTIAMPADTNPAGDIFGGWLLAQMDLAAGASAARRARGRCATIAIAGMAFLKPVFVGDEVSRYTDILSVGRSSMRISVAAWRRSRESEATEQVTRGMFTFVAIDDSRRARPIAADPPGDKPAD